MAMIGPADGMGEESFESMLCTPDWFASKMKGDIQKDWRRRPNMQS